MDQTLQFDPALLRKYDVSGPRYTSYPTAPQFTEDFDADRYRALCEASNAGGRPLSLYVHIPFCRTVCFYCGCNKIITANYRRAEAYLDRLEREAAMQGELFARARPVTQLHFGGGTPTYLHEDDLRRVMQILRDNFSLAVGPEREFSIEIDPRTVSPSKIALLGELGFNRMSLGVQDFDPAVQKAVNRIQSIEQTREAVAAGRVAGFHSTNLDLIYGLPLQTVQTFENTLDTVLEIRPERLAVYNYAHLPQLFKGQRQIDAAQLPAPETKLAILELTIRKLTDAGYVYIGMDHFALPDDELAVAQREGTLQRNFQGYSTQADCDLVALGVSAIGKIGPSYSQNAKDVDTYYAALDAGKLPLLRGLELTDDDLLRRAVITRLMCDTEFAFAPIEQQFGIRFRDYFAGELERLQPLAEDGLVQLGEDRIVVTPRGRLLLRNIGMVFDAYLKPQAGPSYSKVI
jgi:oxygen-independent coproporphyrinogen III oxidase